MLSLSFIVTVGYITTIHWIKVNIKFLEEKIKLTQNVLHGHYYRV